MEREPYRRHTPSQLPTEPLTKSSYRKNQHTYQQPSYTADPPPQSSPAHTFHGHILVQFIVCAVIFAGVLYVRTTESPQTVEIRESIQNALTHHISAQEAVEHVRRWLPEME